MTSAHREHESELWTEDVSLCETASVSSQGTSCHFTFIPFLRPPPPAEIGTLAPKKPVEQIGRQIHEHIFNYKRVMHVTQNNMGHSLGGQQVDLGYWRMGVGWEAGGKMPFDEI